MSTLNVNVIGERTSGSGVTVDGVLLKDGNVDGVDVSAITPGITEADQWRLTANITNTTADITSNLERNDTTGFGYIGTGMTESSGTFSFPSTGKWQIEFIAKYTNNPSNAAERNVLNYIQVTTNNSTYTQYAANSANMYSTATSLDGGAYTAVLLDVTDTANIKVRFEIQEQAGTTKTQGNASYLRTFMTFKKLGDT